MLNRIDNIEDNAIELTVIHCLEANWCRFCLYDLFDCITCVVLRWSVVLGVVGGGGGRRGGGGGGGGEGSRCGSIDREHCLWRRLHTCL